MMHPHLETLSGALLGVLLGLCLYHVWFYTVSAVTDSGPEGTDWYYECTTGAPIDLTPQPNTEKE